MLDLNAITMGTISGKLYILCGLLLCEIGSFTKSGYLKEEKKHIKYFLIRNQRPILNQFKIK